MKIPQKVVQAAESRKHLGGTLEMLGHYKEWEVYTYTYSVPATIGMPELYLWNGVKVQVVEGDKALDIISIF